jgi:hypothetical protein
MIHNNLSIAILSLLPGAEFSVADEDSTKVTFHDDNVLPSDDEILVECERLDARAVVMAEVERLEGLVTQRRIRDSVTTDDGKQWMVDQEALIATERGKL